MAAASINVMGEETVNPLEGVRINPLMGVVILLFAALVALVIDQVAPWASKSEMANQLALIRTQHEAALREINSRLDAHDRQLNDIAYKLDAIRTSTSDQGATLQAINQRLNDMADENIPYVPIRKKKMP